MSKGNRSNGANRFSGKLAEQYFGIDRQRGPHDKRFDEMPKGLMLRIVVPTDTTPEELSAFLTANNVPVEPERISLRDFPHHRAAAISVPYHVVAYWVEWSLSETPFRGTQQLKVTPFGKTITEETR